MKVFDLTLSNWTQRLTSWEPKYQNIFLKKFVADKSMKVMANSIEEAVEIFFVATKLCKDSWSVVYFNGLTTKACGHAKDVARAIYWCVANDAQVVVDAVNKATFRFDENGVLECDGYDEIKKAWKSLRKKPDSEGEDRIIDFFRELNERVDIGLHKIYPLVAKQWQDGEEWVEREKNSNKYLEPKDKFNATSLHNIGSKIGLNGGEEEAAKKFAASVSSIEEMVNHAMHQDDLDIDYFGKRLNAKVVNGAFPPVVIRSDYSDDGDDEYGVKLLWKFSFAS